MRSPPEEPHLAWGDVFFCVTFHVSPELLSCATGLKFNMLESDLAAVNWPEELIIYGTGPIYGC